MRHAVCAANGLANQAGITGVAGCAGDTCRRRAPAALRYRGFDALHANLSVSHRTLQRAFKRRYGVTMARYLRFHRLWATVQVSWGRAPVWKHVPPEFSFVDQSHFLRDARDIIGVPPESLAADFKMLMQYYPSGSFDAGNAVEEAWRLPDWKVHYGARPGSQYWMPKEFHSV
jgi:AraC-like DNA-binding protein